MHPHTPDVDLLRRTKANTYTNQHGEQVTSKARRAAWDITISAPKGVSAAALVGGDRRLIEAHRRAVAVTADRWKPTPYALTSYVVQSETAKRSILYVDNARAHEQIVNARALYVGASRAVDEVIVVTDEKVRALHNLSRDVSERLAIEPDTPEHGYAMHP